MDIRTKLIFAFVVTSLLSMSVLGAYSYHAAAEILRSLTIRQLDALASARAQDIGVIIQAWRDEVNLIHSRTELRRILATAQAGGPLDAAHVQRILDDAEGSVETITRISVFDLQHRLVATAGSARTRGEPIGALPIDDLGISRYVKRADSGIDAVLHAPLRFEGELVGYIATVVDTRDLAAIVQDRRGLGETGGMMLVAEFEPGRVTQFNPPRIAAPGGNGDWLGSYPRSEASEVVDRALAGTELRMLDVRDHRGEPVWAAVRSLEGFPGRLVVKVDASEELAQVYALRSRLIDVGLAVAALAILVGALVGNGLAAPICRLNRVVERIRGGERNIRADESGEDEVSFLAESFNDLMDQLGRDRS